jgi:hypothetical protein
MSPSGFGDGADSFHPLLRFCAFALLRFCLLTAAMPSIRRGELIARRCPRQFILRKLPATRPPWRLWKVPITRAGSSTKNRTRVNRIFTYPYPSACPAQPENNMNRHFAGIMRK